jgi:peptidoglycan-N-acetylmuramic acid deacetylase
VINSHHSGAIYLLHAISETNAAILGDAIDFFRNQGYQLELFR